MPKSAPSDHVSNSSEIGDYHRGHAVGFDVAVSIAISVLSENLNGERVQWKRDLIADLSAQIQDAAEAHGA